MIIQLHLRKTQFGGGDSCCFLLLPLRGVEAKEMWGKDAAFRGLEVRSPAAHGAYCSDMAEQSEMGHAVK